MDSHCPFLRPVVRGFDRGQGPYQLRSELVQLPRMIERKSLKRPQSFGCQLQQHATPVIAVVCAPNQSGLLASHTQLHNAVVPQTKPLCRVSHSRGCSIRPSRNLQQKLVLLRLQIELRRRRLAEVKKEPQLVAKLRQYLQSGS
jgi:hypothetical protein